MINITSLPPRLPFLDARFVCSSSSGAFRELVLHFIGPEGRPDPSPVQTLPWLIRDTYPELGIEDTLLWCPCKLGCKCGSRRILCSSSDNRNRKCPVPFGMLYPSPGWLTSLLQDFPQYALYDTSWGEAEFSPKNYIEPSRTACTPFSR